MLKTKRVIIAASTVLVLLASAGGQVLAANAETIQPRSFSNSPTYDSFKIQLATDVTQLNLVGGEKFAEVKRRFLRISPSWQGKGYSGDWCGWNASFLLRGNNFANGKSVYATTASEVFRQVYNNKPLNQIFLSLPGESDAAAHARLSHITLQPGDIVGYFGRRATASGSGMNLEIQNVKAFVQNPFTKKDLFDSANNKSHGKTAPVYLGHFFDHVGVVVAPDKIIEGNRSIDGTATNLGIMIYKKSTTKFQWYGGMVIVRPEWK